MKKENIEFVFCLEDRSQITHNPTYDMPFLPRIGENVHTDTFDNVEHEYYTVTDITHQFYKGGYTVSMFLEKAKFA